MLEKELLPCKNCITLGMCRATAKQENNSSDPTSHNFFVIHAKCSLIHEYMENHCLSGETRIFYFHEDFIPSIVARINVHNMLKYLGFNSKILEDKRGYIMPISESENE